MATVAQTRVLSTPSVYVSGVLVAIVPNTCTIKYGGEVNVRAMSAGGGVIQVVAGVNAEKMLSDVAFELASTPANWYLVQQWKSNSNNALSETILVAEGSAGDSQSFDTMFLTNEPELPYKSDGNIKLEWKGRNIST